MPDAAHARSSGFGLIDLLTTIAIICIGFSLATPVSYLIEHNRAATNINRVTGSIHLARSEAVKRGVTVSLCPNDDRSCGTDWSSGILVFADINNNGSFDDSDSLITIVKGVAPAGELTWRAFGSNNYIRFSARGFTFSQNGSFTYCPANNNRTYARQIIISKTGRPRLALDNDQDGIVEDSKGKNVNCPEA